MYNKKGPLVHEGESVCQRLIPLAAEKDKNHPWNVSPWTREPISIQQKRHHDHRNSHLIGRGYSFRDLFHYHHDRNGIIQADMVIQIHIDPKTMGSGLRYWVWLVHMLDHNGTLPLTRPHQFQKSRTS